MMNFSNLPEKTKLGLGSVAHQTAYDNPVNPFIIPAELAQKIQAQDIKASQAPVMAFPAPQFENTNFGKTLNDLDNALFGS